MSTEDQNSQLVKVLAPALAESELGRLSVEAMLVELAAAVGDYLGTVYAPDAGGTAQASDDLHAAVRPLAQTIDARGVLLAELREAVRPLPVVVNVEIGEYKSASLRRHAVRVRGDSGDGAWLSVETIERVPVSRIPVLNESLALDDGRRVRVVAPPEHVGVSAVLRCRLLSTPQPAEGF